jgi:hypothetical protein
MPPTRVLPCSSGLAVLGSQVYKEHSLWQNRAYRSPGTTIKAALPSTPSQSQIPEATIISEMAIAAQPQRL